jgi:hypothetical protein
MKKSILVLPLIALLSGCTGSGTTIVLDAPTQTCLAKTYSLVEGKSIVQRDETIKQQFEYEVEGRFAESGMMPGNDLIIEYRFIQFDEGNRFVRYLVGGLANAGEGTMTIEIVFKNKNKEVLNKIQVGGKITAGLFGGSFDNAVEEAANQVVKYTVTNFKK